jgi:hypothetical protein
VGRVADATASAPRRSDDAIAVATARSSNNGDEAVPPRPAVLLQQPSKKKGHPHAQGAAQFSVTALCRVLRKFHDVLGGGTLGTLHHVELDALTLGE